MKIMLVLFFYEIIYEWPAKKFCTVAEPLLAHIRSIMGLDRFTLRTKKKVDIQWKLYSIVHNMKKIHRYGMICVQVVEKEE